MEYESTEPGVIEASPVIIEEPELVEEEPEVAPMFEADRKSTRQNTSHTRIA